jgi:hypothetical protein
LRGNHCGAQIVAQSNVPRQAPGKATDEKGFIVALTGVETAQRPEVLKVQTCEDTTVAKVAISKNTRQQTINKGIQFNSRHPRPPWMSGLSIEFVSMLYQMPVRMLTYCNTNPRRVQLATLQEDHRARHGE